MGAESFLTLQIADFAEGVDDRVAALLTAGNGITLTYNDGAGTLIIASTVSPTWGSIGGTLSNQTDLQTALNAKMGGSTGSVANRVLTANGTGGSTVQASPVTLDGSGNISGLGTVGCGAITAPSIGNTGATPVAFAINGNVTFPASVYFGSGNYVGFTNRALLNSPSDGVLQINNWAANALGSLNCGAITASGLVTCQSGFVLASRTKAAVLASSTAVNSGRFQLSDAGLIGREVYPDGTNWRYASDDSIVT